MGTSDLELKLSATASAGIAQISPDTVMLRKSTDITRLSFAVTVRNLSGQEQRPVMVTLTVASNKINKSIAKTVYFMIPKNN
jgi:hypothetical protein